MATKSKKNHTRTSKKPIHHTLREFLFALSYWGSWTRSLLFFVLMTMMLAISLTGVSSELDNSDMNFWYTTLGVSSVLIFSAFFFLYDATYVAVTRYSPLNYRLDQLTLFAAEALAVLAIFSLWLVYAGNISTSSIYLAVFAAALILPLRAAAGLIGRRQ